MTETENINIQGDQNLEDHNSIEEFSSFDISDQGSIEEHSNIEQDHFYKSDGDYPSIDSISTPKKRSLIISNKTSDIGTTNTKPSSRLSSDTFDTPKTVETRASTMTSNTVFYHKSINHQLKFSDATIEMSKFNNIQTKRLSRCSDIDSSLDNTAEIDNLRNTVSLNDLFSNMSLNESKDSYNNNISELQKQVTNYKVQIKLLQGLMRESFLARENNDEDIVDDFGRHTLLKLDLPNFENEFRISDYEELLHSYEALNEKYSECMNNEHEWNNIVLNALNQLDVFPKKEETFNDTLHTFLTHVENMRMNYDTLKHDFDKSKLEFEIQKLSTLLNEMESTNRDMETKIDTLNRAVEVEKGKVKELESENVDLISGLKYFRDRETKYDGMVGRLKEIENHNISLMKDNDKLRQEAAGENSKLASLIKMMSSFHSVILSLLTKVIDPKSCGNIMKVCKNINSDLSINELSKVFTVAHNYEIESLSTILQSYENLMKEKNNCKASQQQVLDLKDQINTLNEKIHSLEEINEKETTRVQELERQNVHFQRLSSRFNYETENLEKLRLEDLNNKWKAAEEALSQYKKGAKKKVAELEEEIRYLRDLTN